jgi:serine/threonine-protein kinase
VVSPGARFSVPDSAFAPYEIVCEVGSRPSPVFVVRQKAPPGVKPVVLVAERFTGAGKAGDAKGADLVREARRMSTLASPNLARVREVTVRGDDLAVFGEFLDGEKLLELWKPNGISLEVALRIIIDALSGLSALHNLRDAKQQPMHLVHGELSPATIVFGLDGTARVLGAASRRAPGARAETASVGYLAPEVHSGEPYDAQADVFSAGVLLWEALTGKRLFAENESPAEIVARVRSKPLPPATCPEKAAWAKGLIDVAAKALAASPAERWPTAAAMAAEIRKLAGLKLAPASSASAFAKSTFGDRVKSRRERLERSSSSISARPPAPPAPPEAEAARVPALNPVREPSSPTLARAPSARALEALRTPEPSLVPDALLASEPPPPGESVLVAPGVSAPVEDVVEVGLESDLQELPETLARSTPSGAFGGFVVDPSAAARPVASPPRVPVVPGLRPPPADLRPPVRAERTPAYGSGEPAPVSTQGAPHFAAAIDVPVSIAPPPPDLDDDLAPTPPAISREGDSVAPPAPNRRRRAIVLGSVGAFGALVFVLAAWRVAHRPSDTATASSAHAAATQSALAMQPLPAASPAAPPAAAAPGEPAAATPASPAPVAAAAPAAAAAQPHSPSSAAKPKPAAAKAAAAHPPAAAHPKPKSKKTFDPNSL